MPETHVLKGEEAVEVLENYIEELEEDTFRKLNEEQARVMIKIAKGLISTIENEAIPPDNSTQSQIFPMLKDAVGQLIAKVV